MLIDSIAKRGQKYKNVSEDYHIKLGKLIQEWQTWEGGPDHAPPHVIKKGRDARDKLVDANLMLAVKMYYKYSNMVRKTNIGDLDEFANELLIGLTRAAEKYSPYCGYRFSTYSYWWIRQSAFRYKDKNQSLMNPSADALTDLKRLARGEVQFKELTASKQHRAVSAVRALNMVSIDKPSPLDGDCTFSDILANKESGVYSISEWSDFEQNHPQEAELLILLYEQWLTPTAVSRQLGMPVHQLRAKVEDAKSILATYVKPTLVAA